MVGGDLIKTYVEVESGMHDDVDGRPQLRAAAAHANYARARLVIAKIDRLVRSIPVMAYLKQQRVQFVACDNPHANELTIDILVAVAADEGRRISQRTRDALAAYKAGRRVSKRTRALHPDGVPPEVIEATAGKLGASLPQCRNLDDERAQEGVAGRRGGAAAAGPRRLRPPDPDDARAPGRRPVARPDRRGPQRPGPQDPAREALEQDPGQARAGSGPAGVTGGEPKVYSPRWIQSPRHKVGDRHDSYLYAEHAEAGMIEAIVGWGNSSWLGFLAARTN